MPVKCVLILITQSTGEILRNNIDGFILRLQNSERNAQLQTSFPLGTGRLHHLTSE